MIIEPSTRRQDAVYPVSTVLAPLARLLERKDPSTRVFLTAAITFFLFANLGAAIAVNRWNKFFFDALEQKDTETVLLALGLVVVLAILSAAFSVGLLRARMRLQVRWRQWLTRTLIGRWLADRHF